MLGRSPQPPGNKIQHQDIENLEMNTSVSKNILFETGQNTFYPASALQIRPISRVGVPTVLFSFGTQYGPRRTGRVKERMKSFRWAPGARLL